MNSRRPGIPSLHASGTSSRSAFNTSVDPNARLHAIFESGFPFSKKLLAHRSCVNAITFSHGNGRWLASAGDDLRVLLWDFHQEDVGAPSSSLVGHRSNIFCLDFSAQDQFLYSGSTDEKILKYDVSTATSSTNAGPVQTFTTHEDNVRGISCHPENEEVFLSAAEDGLIALHDSRAPSGCAGSLMNDWEVTDVRFHPCAEKLFFTADTYGTVCLRDMRMAFGDRSSTTGPTVARDGQGTVMKSNRKPQASQSTVVVNSRSSFLPPRIAELISSGQGTKICVNFLHHLPTLYLASDPIPLAVFSGKNLPGGAPVPKGERSYRNTCTIKHGAFGGPSGDPEDMYYTIGSDDFRAYVWKIPDVRVLQETRRILNRDEFSSEPPRTIAYAKSMGDTERYIPVELCTPLFRLQGHNSIVNSSIFHPHLPQIATSGVERHITIHGPTVTAPNMTLTRTQEDIRQLPVEDPDASRRFIRALLSGHNVHSSEDAESEERNTIDFFDGVIREHDSVNVFTAGRRIRDSAGDSVSF